MVFAVVISITSYLIYQSFRSNLNQAFLLNLKQEAHNILDRVDIEPLQIPITEEEQSIFIWFESPTGISDLYEKPGFPGEFIGVFKDFEAYNSVEPAPPLKHLRIDSMEFQLAERNIGDFGQGTIKLVLMKDNQAFFGQLKSLRNQMIWANTLAVLISALIAILFSKIALGPINRVIQKTNEIKASEKMDRLPMGGGNDEIAALSKTINAMIERIESSIQNQNQFFAMAAHELRTPLANMQSELEYRMSVSGYEKGSETLNSLHEEVIRLKNIVHDFLLMSQLKSETLELRKSTFRLDDLVYDTLERMKPVLSKRLFEIKLSIEADPDQMNIRADREKIEGVLVNLLDNVRRHGSSNAPVIITINHKANGLIITLENKLSEKPDKNQKGMGLGLQIAKSIMKKHGFQFSTQHEHGLFEVYLCFN